MKLLLGFLATGKVCQSRLEKMGWRLKLIVLRQTGKTSWCRPTLPTRQETGEEFPICRKLQVAQPWDLRLDFSGVICIFSSPCACCASYEQLNVQMQATKLKAKACANYCRCNRTLPAVSTHDQVSGCSCNTAWVVCPARCPLFTLFCSLLHPLLSHVCSQLWGQREHSGTWTSHLFTICWTGEWLVRGGWLLIGCGSSTLNQIGCDLAEGSGESMVWNLEETRDCWNSATKLYTDSLRHKSRYNGIPAKWPNWEALPSHALCLPSLVYSTLQPLGLGACVYMCIYVSLQSVWEKARPRLSTKNETKGKNPQKFNKLQLIINTPKSLQPFSWLQCLVLSLILKTILACRF